MREKWMAAGAEKAVLSHQSALALLDLSDNIPNAVHLLLGRELQPDQLEMAVRQALGRGLLTTRELEEEARRRAERRPCGLPKWSAVKVRSKGS